MDLTRVFNRSGRSKNKDLTVATTDSGTLTLIASRGATYQIFVQRIVITIKTDAAQNITFQDSAASAKYVYKVTTSPGGDTRWEYFGGEKGEPLTKGKDFVAVLSGAGLGAQIEWTAYETPQA